MALLITEEDVKQLPLSVEAAIPIMEETYRGLSDTSAANGPRLRMPFRNGFMQFAPGALHGQRIAGFKLWANFGRGSGVHKGSPGYDYIYDMETGELLAIIHSNLIGRYRTSAQSAVAVKYLSPADASSIGLYGAGRIAEGQLEAVCCVRRIGTVRVYSRTPQNRAAFCERMSKRLGVDVKPASAPEEAACDADIIITASTSETPILFGDWLTRPCLVVAAGANHWYKREIDEKVATRAGLIVVDEKEHAKVESGNLLWPIAHGLLTWDHVQNLGDVVTGRVGLPDLKTSTILFGSHGLAITDVAMAARTYALARAQGLGTEIPL
jgi:ornithine cyclodeaminase/alanine dehydrogenase-like protein (mu-crystallin family)